MFVRVQCTKTVKQTMMFCNTNRTRWATYKIKWTLVEGIYRPLKISGRTFRQNLRFWFLFSCPVFFVIHMLNWHYYHIYIGKFVRNWTKTYPVYQINRSILHIKMVPMSIIQKSTFWCICMRLGHNGTWVESHVTSTDGGVGVKNQVITKSIKTLGSRTTLL